MRFLFLLFIVTPIVEMWLLFKVAGLLGATETIGLVLLTAALGVMLLRQQGFKTLLRGKQRLDSGQLPAQEILEGLILAVSGALLLTPGFITDSLGFLGLLPWSRRWLAKKVAASARMSSFSAYSSSYNVHQKNGVGENSIEGEFWREDNSKDQ